MDDVREKDRQDITLDPENWEELRQLGHQIIDDLINDLSGLRDKPVWQPVPANVRAELDNKLPPLNPGDSRSAYNDFRDLVSPFPRGNNHPRFWGWVNGTSLPMGILADLLASAMNPSVSSFENAANLVEEQVLSWLKHMLGFPETCSALLTSGTSMSNIIALAVARNAKASVDIQLEGMTTLSQHMILYCSRETHSSVQKAVELLGLGRNCLRQLPVSRDYRIDLTALRAAIEQDQRAGRKPFCIIGNVGTVNTGAIDDIAQLADICEHEDIWLHLDGAFGALAWLCPEIQPVLGPLNRADSLAFDLHKWMFLPYDIGCVFIKDAHVHRNTFSISPSYLASNPNHDGKPVISFPDFGIELSRRFRALKIWLCLKEHGVRRFENQIRQNIWHARYLGHLIQTYDRLQLAAPISLNVVCFRFAKLELPTDKIDALNLEIVHRLQYGGLVFPSHTVLDGRVVIRVAITNHRSRLEDYELLVNEVVRLGSELLTNHDDTALENHL